MATKTKTNKSPLPVIGRQGPSSTSKKSTTKVKGAKGNGNIMSFFKKSEQDAELFVGGQQRNSVHDGNDEDLYERGDDQAANTGDSTPDSVRFNESGGAVKRQKMASDSPAEATSSELQGAEVDDEIQTVQSRSGPFLEDSDSEHDDEHAEALIGMTKGSNGANSNEYMHVETNSPQESIDMENGNVSRTESHTHPAPPPLPKEETSYGDTLDDFNDFEGMDDFDEDPFEEGDEYMERRYMEEQARLEAEEDEKDYDPLPPEASNDGQSTAAVSCPICASSLTGMSEQDAGVHVNNCLDGNPSPVPKPKAAAPQTPQEPKPTSSSSLNANSFRKPSRAPKPGQANPFSFGQPKANGGSAFNMLMSGHAEDAAWAEAAASEHASRGKPSYQRTCPFYKILPGLFICVDAFRYGAVQGCQAYFLSHFHSDHYIGLTSHWSHGPIFCSKVTGNLVRQQLRVDPKYVVDLEFEKTVEVPNTKGVKVTMIPANHCPGSSLFLFEKAVGKKPNGEPRLQRILHCGDFRACKKHIEHPLLMPDVQNKLTDKNQEQKIDVCYLDTTYLNPKYAFPSQENVIRACADMCVSLSKHTVDESDGWEQMKRQRAGDGMVKFIRKESNPEIKQEPDDDTDGMKLQQNPNGSQQVLSTSTTPNAEQGRGRLLVVVGTYSIGKERICLGIAKALNSKIYAPSAKQRIVAALEDPELDARMTSDPRAAQVHMTPLFEIRADTLDDYLKDFFPHFTRAVGFRPSGWNYRPPNSRFTESPSVQTVLHSDNWKSTYSMKDLVPQRGSTSRASCFGVPYSEHSSFRELTMFCCALRIEKVIPTVNVGSKKTREKMKAWCERWAVERRKNGLYQLPEDGSW
jgi:DNA cross-link repair 1A protein